MHFPFNMNLVALDLDKCMLRSKLPPMFPEDQKSVVAVIGNSHSGVLCCKNLYEIAKSQERDIKIINFGSRPIKYAKYVDNGIIFDNTGLKGSTAEWVLNSGQGQDSTLKKYLPRCTHIIYVIGYSPSPLPKMYLDGKEVGEQLLFDMHSSGFHLGDGAEHVPGLYANGIAFPEEVQDPEGHIEAAVGVAKFFRFAEKVKQLWLNLE
ncbi:hypothetical protein N7448_002840 [Penicillium atrosanguineum]|uniref:Uncharacterized protein n=1 Tax=Penicillium atrosanguineum TaxID=1132637 RepID=A0A9W9H678_9EURO|nr:hypothetical protein N7526_008638 [Penicillium atrosanguineum]KAJ5139432.1 hypothetical protein N7448_002840 [Penicillium atrosanguineum]KAJ5314865.1 hypothetical protein N7476_005172 [Penicillium atrosanguineum]